METRLVIVRPFGPHERGDVLTDASELLKILASEHAANVVRVNAAAPAPGATTDRGTATTNFRGS